MLKEFITALIFNIMEFPAVKAVKKCLGDDGIQIVGPWPGNCPDLNPIENCQVILKQKVALCNPSLPNYSKQAIKEIWVKEILSEY